MNDFPIPTNNTIFDEQPIGNTSKLMLDEYPPDFDPSKIQAKAQPLPIGKRLASKVWKVRKQALQELLKIVINQNHKQFQEHESVIVKSMTDANMQCQVLSTKILHQYLEKEGSYDGESKAIIKNVIEKLMVIEKEQIQNLGMEILFWFMDHRYQELLMNQLNEYLTNKNPKIMGACLKVIQTLVNNYGPKKLGSLELFSKHLKLLTEAVRPMAKLQTIELYKQLYKWMGEAVFSSFSIHTECKDEVLKWSKTYQILPMQIKRGLKKGEQGKKVNPMEQQQQNDTPVDILHHFDSRWVDNTLEIVKWQQKKKHLQDFIKKTNVRSIVPRQTSHYITLIKRLFSDNNINLLQCGFKIVKNLCKGLKKAFALSCKSFLSYVYLKLKDNKAMIVDETLATLKAMTYSLSLQDLQQQITEGLKDKSPQMRLNTLKLLKDLSAKKQQKTTKIIKSLLSSLIALTNDSTSEVRDVALTVLCKIKEHHGMIFFQDKLQSLPAKKVNQIRSTPTIGAQQQDLNFKMQVQEVSYKSCNALNSQKSIKNNVNNNKQNTIMMHQKKKINPSPSSEPQIHVNKNSSRNPEPIITKLPSFTPQNKQKQEKTLPLPIIQEENRLISDCRSDQRQIMQIRNEEWPIVPTSGHVLRLINLFTKLGEPFATLATPFKLKFNHVEILQNCENSFMTQNADLLLKWALWRIQIQNSQIIEKITSVVIHLIFLLKTNMSDSQTLLIMSILSNLLQSDFSKNEMLRCINTSILEISEFLRQKVFNFWITTLNQSTNNPEFCEKILNLLRTTFSHIQFSCSEIVAMARVEAIVNNKTFMDFLLTKSSKEILKVSGFKLEEQQKAGHQWVLRQSESQFCTEIRVDQRLYFFDIFRRTSHEAMEQIRKLQQSCRPSQIMNLHIKLMDTIMLPYLGQSLQSINVYNYFKLLTARISMMCEPQALQIDSITPHLRNLMRLVMFFLIDMNDSKLDNKDELIRTVNKIILVLLEKMPADHLLEVMTMLLKYSVKNNLTRKLSQLLMKCIQKTTSSVSFSFKAQKNVKLLFNFFIQLIQQFKITDEDPMIKSLKSIFVNMTSKYKELCIEIVIEKLNQFNGNFISHEIQSMFKNFIGFVNKAEENPQSHGQSFTQSVGTMNLNCGIEARAIENNQSMSNLPFNYQLRTDQIQQRQIIPSNSIIRQATNIQRKSQYFKPQIKSTFNNAIDLSGDEGGLKILQERKKIQNYNGLCQSFQELTRMKEQMQPSLINQTLSNEVPRNNDEGRN